MVKVSSYYLSLLTVACFNLAQDLCMEVLMPIYWALWRRMLMVGNCVLVFFLTVFHQIQKCIHQLMRYVRYHPGSTLFRGVYWTYYVLVFFYKKNGYKVILRAIQYELLFILSVACLDWMWMVGSQAVKRGLQFLKQEQLENMNSSSATVNSKVYTSLFHDNEASLRQHIPHPNPFTRQNLSSSLSFMSKYPNNKEGIKYCCFGTSSGQSTRIQGKDKEESGLSILTEDLIDEMKRTFVTYFLLYMYSTFHFVQVIK